MTKSRLLFLLLSLACLVPFASGSLSRAATQATEDSLTKQLSVFSEVLSLIRRAYVEETAADRLLAGALDGTVDALDPLSTFVPASEVEGYLAAREVGSRHSGLNVAKERGIAFVVAVEGGSPAAASGLERGDIIARVGERSTRRMPLWRLQELLAGEPGTELVLEILRQGQSREMSLVLAAFEPEPARLEERDGVSVLRLPRLESAILPEVRALLAESAAQGRGKLILDLRGVAGGDSEAAYAVAGLFFQGDLGILQLSDAEPVSFRGMAAPLWSGEIVVLIDGGCLGPAEILASILRQAVGARLVGQRTFGLAGRQRLIPLSDGGRLLLTDAFYTAPDGEPIDASLVPDVTVSERSRGFEEREIPLDDLILEQGLELLLSEEAAADVAA